MMNQTELKKNLFSIMKEFVYRYADTPFLLASGKESNHYFNCKEVTLHPERLKILCEVFVKELIPIAMNGEIPESIGGLTLGADPISYGISLEYSNVNKIVYPLVVRKETKDHGTKKKIEGFYQKVKKCLVIDDVITTGGSTWKAVESLRESGIAVSTGICILDREEGGKEFLASKGVEMFSIFKKSDFFS
jgi:orotate phosphoribosyltransferase